jgi:hypothetical protein
MAATNIIGDAFIEIKPDTKNFAAAADRDVTSQATSLAKKAAGAFAVTFAAQKIFSFGKDAVREAEEARKIAAQTAAVIKSTGGVAKVSAKDVDALSNAISKKTGVDDESIATLENLLLTFTNVRNEVGETNDIFSQATKIAVDMGAAFGKDAASQAILLGKALNDPTKGLTALTRVGVTFTAQQKENIKAFQASGDLLGAQKIILAELATEFGGSAEAQATASDKLGVVIGNLKEDLGAKLLPIIDAVATGLSVALPKALDLAESAVGAAADLFSPLIEGAENVFRFIFDPNEGALGKSNFQRGLEEINTAFNDFLLGAGTNNSATAQQVAKAFGIAPPKLGTPATGESGLLGITLQQTQQDAAVIAAADKNASNLDKLGAKVEQTIADVFGVDITAHASTFSEDLKTGLDIIKHDFEIGSIEVSNFIKDHGGRAIGDALGAVGRFLGDSPSDLGGNIVDGMSKIGFLAIDGLAAGAQAAVGGVVTKTVGIVVGAINLIGSGVDAVLGIPKFAINLGVSIVDGMVEGIGAAGGAIAKEILSFIPKPQDLPGLIVRGVKGFANAVNPFNAAGGTVLSGGIGIVGERGPEVVRLPAGATITPNDRIADVSRGGVTAGVVAGSTFHVEQLVVPAPPGSTPLEVAAAISEHFAWRFGMEAA